jgi:FtsZ-binding cell division protein ZapB
MNYSVQLLKRDDELSRVNIEMKRLTDEVDQQSHDKEQLDRENSRLRDELRANTDEVCSFCVHHCRRVFSAENVGLCYPLP